MLQGYSISEEDSMARVPMKLHLKKDELHKDVGKASGAKITQADIAKEKSRGGVYAKRAPPFARFNATVKVRGPRCTDVAGLLISGMNRVRTVCPSINLTTCGCIRS